MVGVHMVGARMGELIGEAQLIVNWEAFPEEVAQLVHAHPTQNEAMGEAHLALAGKPLHVHAEPVRGTLTRAPSSTGRARSDEGDRRQMSESVQMPALGESVTEGTVTRWLKQDGEHVDVDEPLLEVSTDKVDTEIPSPVAGVLQEILVSEDETVAVGPTLAMIGDGATGATGTARRPRRTSTAAARPPRRPHRAVRRPGQAESTVPTPDVDAPPVQPSSTEVEEPAERPHPSAQPAGDGERVQMPALGESVTEGTVTRWLKHEGDSVEVDEPLLEVSTDKVDTEIPSPVAGVLRSDPRRGGRDRRRGRRPRRDRRPAAVGPAPRRRRSAAAGRRRAGTRPGTAAAPPAPPAPPEPAARRPPRPRRSPDERTTSELPRPGAAAASAAAGSGGAAGGGRQPRRSRPRRPAADRPQSQRRRTAGRRSTYVTPLVRKLAAEHGVDLADAHRHRRRRPHPQAGRARRRREGGQAAAAGRTGRRAGPAGRRGAGRRRPPQPSQRAARHAPRR